MNENDYSSDEARLDMALHCYRQFVVAESRRLPQSQPVSVVQVALREAYEQGKRDAFKYPPKPLTPT